MTNYKAFEQEASRLLQQYHVPGCVVAIAKHGEVIYEKAFGYRDVASERQINSDTVFGLASLTKSFTCAAIMRLAELGKIRLDDAVIRYLPELDIKDKSQLSAMTIAHFMTHSSGLPPLPSLDFAMTRRKNNVLTPDYGVIPSVADQLHTYEDLLRFINEQNANLVSKPGALFSYSNDAYALLGAIIERVTGTTYEDFVLEEILKPCGMKDTHFLIDDYGDYDNMTTCYEIKEDTGEVFVAEDWWDAPPMRATGFLKSTVNDMMRYATLYINKGKVDGQPVLSEESIDKMVFPHIKMDPEKMYGFGLSVTEDYHGTVMLDHGGSLASISSKFAILPNEGISAIVLTNMSGFPAGRLLLMTLNAYFGRNLDADHLGFNPVKLPEEVLKSYTGNYSSGEGMDCTLRITKDGEPEFFFKDKQYPITFIAENVFTVLIDDVAEPVEVLKDENDAAFALSIYHRVVPKIQE